MPQGQPPNQPWFIGAPLTKFMVYSTIISYVLIETQDAHQALTVDSTATTELYRFLTGTITFASTGELIFGLILMFNLSKRFEREMGTRKYFIFLLGVAILAIAFQIFIAHLVGVLIPTLATFKYSGPYPTLGALLGLFYIYTPRLHPRFFGIFGFHFSEKTITYILATQVILYHGIMTLIPTFSGIFAGYIMAAIPPLNQWDIPDTVARIFTNRFLQSFIDDPPTPTIVATGRHNPFAGIGDAPPPPRRQRAAPPPPPQPETQFQQLPPPSESSIEQLTSMGFQRDAVIQALRTSHNDVERAADRLLSGG